MRVAGIGIWASVAVSFLCGGSTSAQLRINELMHSPSGGEPEWVELYNTGPDSVNIKGWTICNKNRVNYFLRTSDHFVPAHSFLVLTNSNTFTDFHPEAAGSYIVVAWSQYFLVNTGDTVSLRDADGRLADSVFYASSWGGTGGRSLERKSVADSSRARSNWGTCIDPHGSTPGRINSIAVRNFDLKITSFSAAYLAGESKLRFDVNVKNAGSNAALSYQVVLFLDYNGDSTTQREEQVSVLPGAGLNAGDSARFISTVESEYNGNLRAVAVITFDPDEDTTNNRMTSQIEAAYSPGSVVINEIMYAPTSPQPEWVELYNASSDTVVLDRFKLGDNSGTTATLPANNLILPPAGYAVVADDSTFLEYHPDLSGEVIVAAIPSLNNSGDAVIVRDASGTTMDSVYYSPSWGGNSGGKSLERILPHGSSNDPQNFETCVDTSKSTPAKINSVTPRDHDLAIGSVAWLPPTLQSGDSAVMEVHVVNAGLLPSSMSKVILYSDKDNDLQYTPDESTDSALAPEIQPGDSAEVILKTATLTFGNHRYGIVVNYTEDERTGNNSKSLVLNVGLPRSTVIINELMYAPRNPESEWVELCNTGGSTVDLSDFRLVSHGSASRIPSGSLIPPAGYIVFCKDSSVARLHGGPMNLVIQSVPSLNNAGSGVALYDNLGNLLDTIDYRPSYGGDTGRSLERVDCLAGSDSTNWEESVDTTGATPGFQNSVATLEVDAAIKRLDLSNAPTSPGGTGEVAVVVTNRGRQQIADIPVDIDIVRDLDSENVYSETSSITRTLAPGDSDRAHFSFTLKNPGSHTIKAAIHPEGDLRLWNDTMSAAFDVGYVQQAVVINEIMFTKGSMGEYFELYNQSADPIDLSGWTFNTSTSQPKLFQYSKIPLFLARGGYYVIASDSSILNAVLDTNSVVTVKSLTLRDDGDGVVIRDPSGNIVDSVSYLPSWHNADIARTAGRSLERISPSLPSNEKSSWSTSVSQNGGTPGARNSLFINPGQSGGSISVSPNPFSPDGDGHDDFTLVSYSFAVTSVKIRIRIYDTMGRLISTPADNIIVPSTGKLVWDGRDGSGRIVRFGLYILLVEVSGPDGNPLMTYKKPLVVAKRMR